MDQALRHSKILSWIETSGEVRADEVADRCDVSVMTVRRDLQALEEQGLLERTRGGAIPAQSGSYEPAFAARELDATREKTRIAERAAEEVRSGDTLIIDSGTTCLHLARALRERSNITILTPSLRVAWEFANKATVRLLVTGGRLREGELSFVGPHAEAAFEGLMFDVFFMGVGGLHRDVGVSDYNLDDARVKRKALTSARKVVALADQRKLGRSAFGIIGALDQIDTLITNSASETIDSDMDWLRDSGINVEVV